MEIETVKAVGNQNSGLKPMQWKYAMAHVGKQLPDGSYPIASKFHPCRGYMANVFRNYLKRCDFGAVGFNYSKHGENSIDLESPKIVLLDSVEDEDVDEQGITPAVRRGVKALNEISEIAGFKPVILRKVELDAPFSLDVYSSPEHKALMKDASNKVVMLEFDKRWIHSTPLFSFFLFVLRLGCRISPQESILECFEKENKLYDTMSKYYFRSHDIMDLKKFQGRSKATAFLLSKNIQLFLPSMRANWEMFDLGYIHDYSGFDTWSNWLMKKRCGQSAYISLTNDDYSPNPKGWRFK